ncbi:hypothetical protein SSS_08695 [Sarcoptes scabiei]|uniref:Large ribosomal subunit protein mL50 n=1 Tax=Sarcoptes scabiei TaxID=52283 RepID=A0A131ZUA8_SARSC|nr:hypothetical protein SSS_08695 [Sarcoptes scabiei]KPM02357.1 Mitochondrial 50S ribosomal L50-like protein [Sarcoptes scabiei]
MSIHQNELFKFVLNLIKINPRIFNTHRYVHYMINQDGEKIVISTRTKIKSKREKWQNVRPMGYEKELKKIREIEWNERLHCDPELAYETSLNKFQKFSDELKFSGLCRYKKSYQPLENTIAIIDDICKKVFPKEEEIDSIIFKDLNEKFRFLSLCYSSFNHEVANADLHRINSIKDVKEYYMKPINTNSKLDQMASRSLENLPKNLHVISEPLIFNPKTDTFFNGANAYPGLQAQFLGLRARKKYPSYPDYFVWPDI